MGVDVSVWRARIGCFIPHGPRERFVVPAILVGGRFRLALRLVTLALVLLLVAGDVESNPGPGPYNSSQSNTNRGGGRGGANRSMSQSVLSFETDPGERRVTRNQSLSQRVGTQGDTSRLSTDERLDLIFERLNVLDSLDDRIQRIESKLDESLREVHDRVGDVERGYDELQDKLSKLEEQSRRDNLIFWGIPEKKGTNVETWEECELAVREVISDTLGIENASDDSVITIERAHRLGRRLRKKSGGRDQDENAENTASTRPRGIIVKFGRWKHRQSVFEKARTVKDDQVRVTEDYAQRVRDIRKRLIPHMIRARNEDADRRCVIRYDKLLIGDSLYSVSDSGNLLKLR